MKDKIQSVLPEKTRRKAVRNAILAVCLAIVMVLTFFSGFFLREITQPPLGNKISEIIKLIDDASVYYDQQTADQTIKRIVGDILKEDKYAAYYSPAEYSRILSENQGNYSGIGIGFGKSEGGIFDGTVGKVYLNSSAHKSGIQKGDKLVAGKFTGQSGYTYFASLVSENKTVLQVIAEFLSQYDNDEEIWLKVLRGEEEKVFTVKKTEYAVSYVEYKDDGISCYYSTEEGGFKSSGEVLEELSADTAYIKLHDFEGGAASQFNKAIEYMRVRGKTKLIIDLRDNGGGLITVLSEILSYLINDNGAKSIKIMEVKETSASRSFYTSENRYNGFLTDISVIANCNTASASECLIGALNDYGDSAKFGGANFNLDRLILTEKHKTRDVYSTFGKGIMQTTYSLRSGGALVLTTAYVYWPLSKTVGEGEPVCIQDIGIRATSESNCVSDEFAISRADAVLH